MASKKPKPKTSASAVSAPIGGGKAVPTKEASMDSLEWLDDPSLGDPPDDSSSSSSSSGTPPCSSCSDTSQSNGPIRYSNGLINLSVSDLSSRGFGIPWGHTRSYTNLAGGNSSGINGNNWFVAQMPTMIFSGGNIGIVQTVAGTLWFQPVGTDGQYQQSFYFKSTLRFDSGTNEYILLDPDGTQTIFDGDAGEFKGMIDAAGNTSIAEYTGSQLTAMEFTSGSQTGSYAYTYYTSGENINQLETVKYSLNGTDVQRCTYAYYGSSDTGGSLNDLQSALVEQYDASSSSWFEIGKTYYRYYLNGDTNGFVDALKYVAGPEAYERMVNDGITPETASDSELAGYADYYFEYDNANRVTFEAVDGGGYQYSFTYEASPAGTPDLNSWAVKTVETLPDGNQNIVYSNKDGQVMLKVFAAGAGQWYEYYQFDGQGRWTLKAESSAVESYDESDPALVTLNGSSGLIHVFEYYDDPSETGYAPGYQKSKGVQEGTGGSPITVSELQYATQTVDGSSIYPIAASIIYQSDASGGSDPAETDNEYEFYSDSYQVQQSITTLPVVSTDQNGSGSANRSQQVFDQYGRLTWAMDERGFITNMTYDIATGAMIRQIRDVNTSIVSGAPSGWTTPTGGGLNLVTDIEIDLLGRPTQMLGPSHQVDIGGTATTIRTAQWTVYRDDIDQTWAGQGYATGTGPDYTYTLVNPVSITQVDKDNRVTDRIQAIRSSTSGALSPTDSYSQTSWSRWTHTDYDDQSHLIDEQVYFLIPSSGSGTSGTNYNQTNYGYDVMGRKNRVQTPGGTITRTVYQPCGCGCDCLVLEVWVGTNDTGATDNDPSGGGATGNNMVQILVNEYDNGEAGGDENLTQQTLYQDASTTRVTSYGYDFRDRKIYTDGEIDFYETYTYDNLDRIIQTQRYDTTADGNLIARNATAYDPMGRTFQKTVYGVDPSTGDVGNALVSNSWYDPSGNLIVQANAGSEILQKTVYDGVNRETLQYTSCNLSETGYPYPISVSSDTVMRQVELAYDAASNLISQTTRLRFHNATGTGALTTPGGSQPKARVYYRALYPDPINRQVAVVNCGTNGASSWTRLTTIPTGSSTILVSQTVFNSQGDPYQKIDPQGTVNQSAFDNAGRIKQLLENYISGGTGVDQNRETDFTYNPDSKIASLTAKNSVTGDQVTQFVYGTSASTSDVVSNELLVTKIYPDDTTGAPDRITYCYNRLGQQKLQTDQNGTVREYDYDLLGRLVQDRVTTLGSGVDNTVLRISRTYEVRGMLQNATSYDDATVGSGSVVNDVQMAYNRFSQLDTDYQSHSGTVNTSTTPNVQYGYADGSANTVRPTLLTYPSGREISYDYSTSGSMPDALSRINGIDEGSDTRAGYTYLGLGTIVQINDDEPGIEMTYIAQGSEPVGDAGDQYTGLDRFGRVVDSRWINSSGSDINRVEYGYSEASNRIWRQNIVAGAGQDEYYTYDGLYQLDDLQRGTLNSGHTGISGTPAWEEDFTYDPIGNWQNYLTKESGSTTLDQNRTQNLVNETTSVSGSSTLVGYDKAGNMTTTPQPTSWSSAYGLTWDAWNRLVSVSSGGTSVATYAYDGLNRRTSKTTSAGIRHYYYSAFWQILEERTGTSTSADRQFVWGLQGVDDLIFRDGFGDVSGRLYALGDSMSVTAITDTTGAVQERYGYDAFGNTNVMNDSFDPEDDGSSYDWETRFCGYRWDDETNFYQVRNRYLQSSLGRWLCRDPLGEAGGVNLYKYVGNDSINFIDPLGLNTLQIGFSFGFQTGPVGTFYTVGIAMDDKGNIGTYETWGGGGTGEGLDGFAGVSVALSDAPNINNLTKTFANVSIGAGDFGDFNVDYFHGNSDDGPVTGGGVTIGFGLGGGVFVGPSYTWIQQWNTPTPVPVPAPDDSPSGGGGGGNTCCHLVSSGMKYYPPHCEPSPGVGCLLTTRTNGPNFMRPVVYPVGAPAGSAKYYCLPASS